MSSKSICDISWLLKNGMSCICSSIEKEQFTGRARGKTIAEFESSDSFSFVEIKDACREEPPLPTALLFSGLHWPEIMKLTGQCRKTYIFIYNCLLSLYFEFATMSCHEHLASLPNPDILNNMYV